MPTGALKEHLLHQFRHTRHANDQIIEALGAMPEDARPERAVRLLGHLLRAQDVHLGRIRGRADLPAIWSEDTLADCRARADASHAAWRSFLEGCAPADFERTIHYENSKGRSFANALREICGHVVNHSTHHRAQIALLIRAAGGEPPVTDYLLWARASPKDASP